MCSIFEEYLESKGECRYRITLIRESLSIQKDLEGLGTVLEYYHNIKQVQTIYCLDD